MRRFTLLTLLSSAMLVLPTAPAVTIAAEQLTGRQIMERVDERDDGDNETSNLEMILIDKRGNQRVRELERGVVAAPAAEPAAEETAEELFEALPEEAERAPEAPPQPAPLRRTRYPVCRKQPPRRPPGARR